MPNLPSISFIIPCYNSSEHLLEAIRSLLSQDYEGPLEFVFVVDPSTDQTLEILNNEKDPRIKIIANPVRLGVSPSRELGIKESVGEYLAFMDADDYIEPYFASRMMKAILRTGADSADCCFKFIKGNNKESQYFFSHRNKTLSKYQAVSSLLGDCYLRGFLWNKLFKRELLMGEPSIKMPLVHMFEDMPLVFLSLYKGNKTVCLRDCLYHYRVGQKSSLSGGENPKRAKEHLEVFALMKVLSDRLKDPQLVKIISHKVFRMSLSLSYDLHLSKKGGLSKKEAKLIKSKLRLLKKKEELPIVGEPWETFIEQALPSTK